MNIYKIKNTRPLAYNLYISAVVVTENERDARLFHPIHGWNSKVTVRNPHTDEVTNVPWYDVEDEYKDYWCTPHQLEVELIGVADPKYTVPTLIEVSYFGG